MVKKLTKNELHAYFNRHYDTLSKQFMFNPGNLSKNDIQAIRRFGIESKLQKIINSPSPRFIKSHLALEFYPLKLQNNSTNAKIIFVTRNPRDVCISQYHHCQLVEGFQGTLEEFAILFMRGLVPYGPYWDYIHSFWKQRSKLNIIFVRFEDMKTKPIQTITKICKFLDKSYTDDEIYELAEHLTFDNMKKIDTINKENFTETMKQLNNVNKEAKFMRSGQIHQWRTKLNPEIIRQFEHWEKENLKGSDFTLNYDEE